ncbi:uncharacterized protein LOC135123403 [Zophobas morio]|uniref:uncharacterized protein LOC135123403 n=1 Tax=Zophobas morio TaxID=2755281 RepID=UPI0030838681
MITTLEMEKGFESFKKRSGTTDKGKDYEDVAVANVVLELVNNVTIKNFHVSSNEADFGAFDDLVIKTESEKANEVRVKAVQLKHSETQALRAKDLQKNKGNFSIAKYLQSFKEIKVDVDELILFTNRPFKCDDKTTFQLEEEEFSIKAVKTKATLEFLEKTDCVYQFEIIEEDWSVETLLKIREYQTFFSKFYLYTDQENVEKMKGRIAEKFITRYVSDEETFDRFLRTISQWNMQDGVKEKLNKKWVQRLIALQLLFCQIEPLSFGSVIDNDKMIIFREVVSSFDITLCKRESYEALKQLWGDSRREENIDFKELNLVRERYLPTVRYIDNGNIDKTDPKILMQLLWLMDKCPLTLRQHENVDKAIQLCPDKKFILIGEGKNEEWMQNYSVFQNLSNLKPDLRDEVMQNFTISIQGKGELDLVTAFGNSDGFLESVTTDSLLEMLNGPYPIGGEQETLPEPYIGRYLPRNVVNITYLEKAHENTVIVLNCANNFDTARDKLNKCNLIDIENFLQKKNQTDHNSCFTNAVINLGNNENNFHFDNLNLANTIYIGNRHYNDSELQQIYTENQTTKQFHYFQLLDDGNLEWVKSKGDVSDLEVYKLSEQYSTDENTLWSSRLENSINLITGDPGIGKSELMKSFKNKCPPKYWTVIINPQDVNSFFYNSEFPETTNYIDLFEKTVNNCQSVKKLDREIFKMCIERNNVVYVWDALDEILSDNLDDVLKIILHLSSKGFHQWVTSRRNLKPFLEKHFSLLALSINRFSEDEQENYCRNRLNTFVSSDQIEVTIEKIKSSFAIVEHVDILGVPLQIFMLTELFRQNHEKYLKLMDNTFLLTDLYDYFIAEKLNIFYQDKIEIDIKNPHLARRINKEKREALDLYERVAFKVVFHDEILQQLNIDFEKCLETVVEEYASLGFVKEFQNNVPRFLHSSFAEYLVAVYIFKNTSDLKVFIADILFGAKYDNVRFFFDMLLAKNSKAHIAVLYKNYETFKTYDDEILTLKDKWDRSALHLISSWGKRHPRIKITQGYIVQEDRNFDKKSETEAYFEALAYLQQKNNVDEFDTLLNATPLSYATKSESLGAELKLLRTKQTDLNRLCTRDDIINFLYYSALFGYDDVCILLTAEVLNTFGCEVKLISVLFVQIPLLPNYYFPNFDVNEYLLKLFVEKEFVITLLYIASGNGHEKIVDYLETVGAEIDRAAIGGHTPLYLACQNGHENVVKYLATAGAEINRANNEGWTPLLIASFHGHGKVVQYLVTFGAQINPSTNHGWTALHVASEKGHEKIVDYLATVGAEINCANNNNGSTPLHLASRNGHEEVVQCLVRLGVEVNRAENNGCTPLFIASQNGQEKVVEYLESVGAEVNRANKKGVTPLHVASRNGHEKVTKILTTASAKINPVTKDGWTPLHLASEKGHGKVVEYLATAGAEINRVNKNGSTPLFMASRNGHETIVKYLATLGAEINRANHDGWTPLHVACEKGHDKVVEYLVTIGAEVNRANKKGATPLHVASRNGHDKVIDKLTTAGAEINSVRNDGWTPLHIACEKGHEKVVEYLVSLGAEINRVQNKGCTPLFIASHNGQETIVKYLATLGAEINRASHEGWTPLHVASEKGHEKIVEYLATIGAEINSTNKKDATPLYTASRKGHETIVQNLTTAGAEVNRATADGWTPLHIACEKGHEVVVEYLTTAGAEINHIDNDGDTPLHVACENGHETVVEYLVTKGAELNRADNDGWTPLHVASFNGHEKIVEYLATAGAEINRVSNNGLIPLHVACDKGHEKVVEYLVTKSVELNRADNNGWTPLHVASFNGHEKIVEYLVTVGADISQVDNYGSTPLFVASFKGYEKVVEYLTTVGAEINRADNEGDTPLHVASKNGHEKVVEYLTTVGAEINRVNKNGSTALFVASQNGHEKVVERLVTFGGEIYRASNSGWTPLHAASVNGHEKVVQYLITSAVDQINCLLKRILKVTPT